MILLAAAPASPEAARPRPAAVPAERLHVVARGDTLTGIAARYRVTVTALVAANRLAGERVVLRVGKRLVIPPATAAAPRPAAAAAPKPPTAAAPKAAAVAPAPTRRPTPATPASRSPRRMPTQGPRGLELTIPDFVDEAPPFVWPVEGPVTSTYGRRRSGWHRGIDIKAERGSVVFAAASGIVVASGVEPRYGRVVKIEHEDGFITVYAHNEENLVQIGMRVGAGDPVATIGRTGRATAHHLHFEIRRGAEVYNPLYLLPLPARVGQVDLAEESEEQHD